jgi:hypothetical protein
MPGFGAILTRFLTGIRTEGCAVPIDLVADLANDRHACVRSVFASSEKGNLMDSLLKLLDGKKTYLGAIAFLGLAIYQFYTGQNEQAVQSLKAAWTAMGLRSAIGKTAQS